jgi:O-antigen biosynthesis protein
MTTFTVITAVHDPVPDHLAACLASVRAQGVVQHVVVDDASTDPAVAAVLASAEGVELHRRATNGGIVAASNDAIARATGEWIVLLDHDDVLAAGAIDTIRAHVAADTDCDVVYSDHDLIRPDGRLADPVHKPDWSPERLRQTNYITHLVAVRRSLVTEIGAFRPGTDGAQDHDLLLRLVEVGARFSHVPQVLAHWRQSPRSVSSDVANKPEAFERGRRVVEEHVVRCGIDATVDHGRYPGVYRIRRRCDPDTLVSVVVPTRGSAGKVWGVDRIFVVDAIRSLLERSTHRRFEVVVVADRPTPPSALDEIARAAATTGAPLHVIDFDEPYNFSRKINVGVAASSGDAVLVLNDDTELIEPESVSVMLGLLDSSHDPAGEVGAVGAKLLYPDGTLQHGGHVYHHEFMHACIGWDGDHPGPHRMLAIERECAGVTAAALMTTRAVFDEIGGFPEDLPLHFNDVDVSLSIRATGRRILWTPHACWYHFEGRTRDRGATMDEWRRVAGRFPGGEPTDPYANPNLAPKRSDWLELPGRSGAPPYVIDADGVKRWG